MNCIVAVDSNFAIGRDNCLLFNIPKDLQFFKEKTTGKTVIMGKNTLLSLPESKPLPNRKNIVLSGSFSRNDCTVVRDLASLFAEIKDTKTENLFVIGGEQVYKLLLPYCSKAYITKINAVTDGNKFFPNLDLTENWELTYKSEKQTYKNIEFIFTTYINHSVKNRF